jgi:hypothetical protein
MSFWILVLQCNDLELHEIATYLTDEQMMTLGYWMLDD